MFEGLAVVVTGGRFGFANEAGEVTIPCRFDDARGFSEGLASVKDSGKWGCIDASGTKVVPFEYDSVGRFASDNAIVRIGNEYGRIGRTGERLALFPCLPGSDADDDVHGGSARLGRIDFSQSCLRDRSA